MTIIGVPKEILDHEYRVAITPAGVEALVGAKHRVLIEKGAGRGSGISDNDYLQSGADLVDRERLFGHSELIAKVKEPQPVEYGLFREGQVIFTYFHFAANRALTEAMMNRGTVCIALETVQLDDRSLPLLAPMSDIAGRLAVSAANSYLERPRGGKGKLLASVPGVRPGVVLVLGGGTAGSAAARMAAGLGAEVYLFDVNLQRLRYIFETSPPNIHPLASSAYAIRELLPFADAVIGTVLVPGGRTPILITREMLQRMEPGSVIVDVSADQGGCVETARPTTHSAPTYLQEGIVHYCVTNMPGAVAHTSTYALTNATFPYLFQLAEKGWRRALHEDSALRRGLNVCAGRIRHEAVARAFGWEAEPLANL